MVVLYAALRNIHTAPIWPCSLAQRKLVVVQAALNVKVGFQEMQIALVATDNGLVVNVEAITDGFEGIGDIGSHKLEIKTVGAP